MKKGKLIVEYQKVKIQAFQKFSLQVSSRSGKKFKLTKALKKMQNKHRKQPLRRVMENRCSEIYD